MPHFLYIRGDPGTGKITVARQLQRELGWELFWFHEVYQKPETDPEGVDKLVLPVIESLVAHGKNIIYVRPSRSRASVEKVDRLVAWKHGYRFDVVRLHAQYDTIRDRVCAREPLHNRISTEAALVAYLAERPMEAVEGEMVVSSDDVSPMVVMARILIRLEKRWPDLAATCEGYWNG